MKLDAVTPLLNYTLSEWQAAIQWRLDRDSDTTESCRKHRVDRQGRVTFLGLDPETQALLDMVAGLTKPDKRGRWTLKDALASSFFTKFNVSTDGSTQALGT